MPAVLTAPARHRLPGRPTTVAGLASLLLLVGAGPMGQPEGEPLPAPEAYRTWWRETEACAGRTGNFERVRWFVREGSDFACPTGRCVGRWESGHRIYVARRWQHHPLVIRHEMLHAILGTGDHPAEHFVTRCGLTWESWKGR